MTDKSKKYFSRKSILVFILLISFSLSSQAQTNKINLASNENLQQILSTLQKDQKANKIWWNSWLGIYAAGTIVQTGIAIQTDSKTLKQDMYLGAATTFLGAGFQLITPIVKIEKNFFENTQDLSPVERLVKMNEAYELLKQSSEFAMNGKSWKTHALTGVANIGGGLITWLGFDRTLKDGIINFAINTVVTEAQIWTQPIMAKKAYQKYSNQFITGEYIPNRQTHATFSACATGSGIQFKVVF